MELLTVELFLNKQVSIRGTGHRVCTYFSTYFASLENVKQTDLEAGISAKQCVCEMLSYYGRIIFQTAESRATWDFIKVRIQEVFIE